VWGGKMFKMKQEGSRRKKKMVKSGTFKEKKGRKRSNLHRKREVSVPHRHTNGEKSGRRLLMGGH